MSKKKRRFSSSSLNPPPSAAVASASETPHPPAESLDPVIFREGSQVQEAIKLGNYSQALLMVRKSISCHPESPHLLYLEAVALQFLAKTAAKDSEEMLEYFQKAHHSAYFASMSLPGSIHFVSCAVVLLYQKALLNAKGWDIVINVCNNTLNLKIGTLTDWE